jgi:hypothetical protein
MTVYKYPVLYALPTAPPALLQLIATKELLDL